MLLVDIFIRMRYLTAHYTNEGILPLSALFRYAWNPNYFSIYTAGSSYGVILSLFAINILCVLNLLIGYKTRLFTFICWIFLISLHNRNPLIHQAGDDLLRLLLFWGLFLPWGNRFSYDGMREGLNTIKPLFFKSWACVAYLLLLFSIYFFSALHKSSPEWTSDFTALYYALSLDQISLPAGKLIYPYEGFLKILTAITYYTELILPFVLFFPFFIRQFRMLFLIVFGMLHLGIALSINVGLFPFICIISMLGLLPPSFFEWIKKYQFSLKMTHSSPKLIPKLGSIGFIDVFPYFNIFSFRTEDKNKIYEWLKISTKILKPTLTVFFIVYTLFWNVRTVNKNLNDFELNWIGNFLRIDQYWSMFAPSVFKDDGWFVLAGVTQEGKRIDIKRNGIDVDYERPEYIAGTYINDRWRKYSENILFISKSHYRQYFCSYMMQSWNKNNKVDIEQLEVIYMKIPSLPGYKEAGPFKEILCTCTKIAP